MDPATSAAQAGGKKKEGDDAVIKESKSNEAPMRTLHPVMIEQQAKDVFNLMLIFRFLNAICLQTFWQPDEYFQALEPAWNVAFGNSSGAWLTWEWQHQLRSSLHPALFAVVYRVIEELGKLVGFPPDLRSVFLVVAPKVVQSLFAGLADFYTWNLATKLYGHESNAPWAAIWMTVFNPWHWYSSTRTFSNSMEATLTIAALYYWPWEEVFGDAQTTKGRTLQQGSAVRSLRVSLVLAALASLLRPTNLIVWFGILVLALTRMTLDGKSPLQGQSLVILAREIVLCGSATLAVSLAADRLYFGSWTFPPYTWLHFNITQSLAVFYGRMPWHYYLSQAVPFLTTTFLPFVLVGLYKAAFSTQGWSVLQSNAHKVLSFVVLSVIAALSVISHKEVRFIYPLLPVLHILAAPYITAFFVTPTGTGTDDDSKTDKSKLKAKADPNPFASPFDPVTFRHKFFLANLLIINLVVAGYLSLFHQAAPLGAVRFIRHEFERLHPESLQLPPLVLSHQPTPNATSTTDSPQHQEQHELFALFLTPCHSTPWRSHLVWPSLRARALTCDPPLHTEPGSPARASYRDEADRFYDDAARFLREELFAGAGAGASGEEGEEDIPRYIVGFEGVADVLGAFFAEKGAELGAKLPVATTTTGPEGGDEQPRRVLELKQVWEGFNGLFNEDERRQGKLVIWDTGAYPSDSPKKEGEEEETAGGEEWEKEAGYKEEL